MIARALATEAPILLLDEPTSALDIGHQQQAFELVARLRRDHGLTVVSAMHDLTLAGMYADNLALMHEGSVVAYGPAADVLRPRRWPSSTECESPSIASQTAPSSSSHAASRSTDSLCTGSHRPRFGSQTPSSARRVNVVAARPHVVVIGAGFGGLRVVKGLRHAPVDVTVIDANNFHTFQPLLYQVATAGLDADDISFPVRGILRRIDIGRASCSAR